MSRALLIVPPFLKYNSGPLLGPALLQSAALNQGHKCSVLDLNARYIEPRAMTRHRHGPFIGDHDKKSDSLGNIEDRFLERNILPFTGGIGGEARRRVQFGFLSHDQVVGISSQMATSLFGQWAEGELLGQKEAGLVGLSLLHAGQVLPAAAISLVIRKLWPSAIIVWGGPHISGIGTNALSRDLTERSVLADAFVTGHAEQTFVHMLDQLGCAYGRCSFCTYPAIEGSPTRLDLKHSVASVAEIASSIGASVSIKDSLATATRLREIGECIGNQAKWSACTKISKRLDQRALQALQTTGLATLELGLESLLVETQRRVSKVQPKDIFETFCRDASQTPLTLVVNYMIGFPWEQAEESLAALEEARAIIDITLGERARIELNTFELERLAPMAKFPELYNIGEVTEWPWASVLEYRTAQEVQQSL